MANRKWKMEKAWQFAISHLPFPIRPGFFSGLQGSKVLEVPRVGAANVSGDELDRAIDDAVRGIMGAEPASDLRQRVVRRLEEPEPRVWFTVPRLAVVAVAVLCVAVGVFVMLTMYRDRFVPPTEIASSPQPARPSEPSAAPRVPDQSTPPSNAARSGSGSAGTARGARSRRQDDRIVAATSLTEAESIVAISLLDPLQKIDPEPVKSDTVRMDAIAIAPLQQIELVTMEPLSSTPR